MIIPVGQIYEVQMHQRLFGEKVLNVFHYYTDTEQVEGPDNDFAIALFVQFEQFVAAEVCKIQNADVKYELISVANAFDYPNRYEATVSREGLQSLGGSDSSFVAFSFKYVRKHNHTRNGSKRFAGVPDNFMVGNLYTGSDAPLHNLANLLGGNMTGEDVQQANKPVFKPCIVHRDEVKPYAIMYGNAVSSVQYVGITTQTSRKRGRGI